MPVTAYIRTATQFRNSRNGFATRLSGGEVAS